VLNSSRYADSFPSLAISNQPMTDVVKMHRSLLL
jgi:hypothetical protein